MMVCSEAVTINANKLEEQAIQQLGDRVFKYFAGGAGEKITMEANRVAFRQ